MHGLWAVGFGIASTKFLKNGVRAEKNRPEDRAADGEAGLRQLGREVLQARRPTRVRLPHVPERAALAYRSPSDHDEGNDYAGVFAYQARADFLSRARHFIAMVAGQLVHA